MNSPVLLLLLLLFKASHSQKYSGFTSRADGGIVPTDILLFSLYPINNKFGHATKLRRVALRTEPSLLHCQKYTAPTYSTANTVLSYSTKDSDNNNDTSLRNAHVTKQHRIIVHFTFKIFQRDHKNHDRGTVKVQSVKPDPVRSNLSVNPLIALVERFSFLQNKSPGTVGNAETSVFR